MTSPSNFDWETAVYTRPIIGTPPIGRSALRDNRTDARRAGITAIAFTELIQGYVVAMNLETTEEELMHTIFPHPTLSEMMKEAVLDAYGRVLNM